MFFNVYKKNSINIYHAFNSKTILASNKWSILQTAEQHSFGVNEAERAKRIQEEAMKNAADMEITVNEDGSIVKKGNTKRNRRSMTNGFDVGIFMIF